MDCRDTLNKMWEEHRAKTKGYWDYADSFEKIHELVQLRRRFVFHAAILLFICGVLGAALFIRCFAEGATPRHFTPMILLIPYLVMAVIGFWSLCHAYNRRKKELAGGEVRGFYNLSRLRWGYVPLFSCFYSFFFLLIGQPPLRSDSVIHRKWFWLALGLYFFSILPWSLWRDYTRLKRELHATDTVENTRP